MSSLLPELDEAVVVIVGKFNPAIFHPSWIVAQGLLNKQELEAANLELVHPDATSFKMASFRFDITRDRFLVGSSDASCAVMVRDIAIGILSILEHTPVRMCGINRLLHFRCSSESKWHHIGHTLTPKEYWTGLLENPGMRSLTIEGKRPDSSAKYLRISIAPSPRVEHGVFFDFNEHYELKEPSVTVAMDALKTHWDTAQTHFLTSAQTLLHTLGAC
jgi:hypothetical protein